MDRVRNEEVRERAGIDKSCRIERIREYWDYLYTWREWMSTVWTEEC